jgi:dTMP kinase
MSLIAFEGMDGSGKSTLVNYLKNVLKEKYNKKVIVVQGLGSSSIGPTMRKIFLDQEISNLTCLWLSLANMSQTMEEIIRPALARGYWVLADRWLASTYAYQIFSYKMDFSLKKFQKITKKLFFLPKITFYLDIPVDIGLKRKRSIIGYELNRFERKDLAYLKQVQKGYQTFYQKEKKVKSYDTYLSSPDLVFYKMIDFLINRKMLPKEGR